MYMFLLKRKKMPFIPLKPQWRNVAYFNKTKMVASMRCVFVVYILSMPAVSVVF